MCIRDRHHTGWNASRPGKLNNANNRPATSLACSHVACSRPGGVNIHCATARGSRNVRSHLQGSGGRHDAWESVWVQRSDSGEEDCLG
eukprot:222674-Prymnesium_polylepis.1